MNDRELLELAAKAAGIEIGEWAESGAHSGFIVAPGVRPNGIFWNPRDDDGDSRRLEVALGLDVDVHRQHALRETPFVEVRGYDSRRLLASEGAKDNGASLEAATRRAVLLAAAAIGKAMP